MFNFIKQNLQKIYSSVTSSLLSIFSEKKISTQTLEKIEQILITADTGTTTTKKIVSALNRQFAEGKINEGHQLAKALEEQLLDLLQVTQKNNPQDSHIFLLLGINGSGKTTFAGKLAHAFTSKGKSCILAAADTFRAAAPAQLQAWAQESNAQIITGTLNQDPASVAFQACDAFKKNNADILIIDTAGRLQTKEHLMKELTKIKQVIQKQFPEKHIHTLLTVDAMLGQNSFEQAKLFHQATAVDGIVLTKIDGTGKGGIIFSIVDQLQIPVQYISFGEKINDMKEFNAHEYVKNLLGSFQD
ncbi:MAG: signal recognition particle-docking protein FtsY [Candidatus Chromulinivorax sp.]